MHPKGHGGGSCATLAAAWPLSSVTCGTLTTFGLGLGPQKARILCWAESCPAGSTKLPWAQAWPYKKSEALCLSESCSKFSMMQERSWLMGVCVAKPGAGVLVRVWGPPAGLLLCFHPDVLMHLFKSKCICLGARPYVSERKFLPAIIEGIKSFLTLVFNKTYIEDSLCTRHRATRFF